MEVNFSLLLRFTAINRYFERKRVLRCNVKNSSLMREQTTEDLTSAQPVRPVRKIQQHCIFQVILNLQKYNILMFYIYFYYFIFKLIQL